MLCTSGQSLALAPAATTNKGFEALLVNALIEPDWTPKRALEPPWPTYILHPTSHPALVPKTSPRAPSPLPTLEAPFSGTNRVSMLSTSVLAHALPPISNRGTYVGHLLPRRSRCSACQPWCTAPYSASVSRGRALTRRPSFQSSSNGPTATAVRLTQSASSWLQRSQRCVHGGAGCERLAGVLLLTPLPRYPSQPPRSLTTVTVPVVHTERSHRSFTLPTSFTGPRPACLRADNGELGRGAAGALPYRRPAAQCSHGVGALAGQ